MNIYKIFPTFNKFYKNFCKKTAKDKCYKAIFQYCFRVLFFIVLFRSYILNHLFLAIYFIFNPVFRKYDWGDFVDVGIFAIFSSYIICYIFIKLCGLFKKIKHLNFFIALIIVIAIDFILCYSRTITIQLFPLKIVLSNHLEIFLMVLPCFIIFKFFNSLSNSFPTPFEQIGYFFSIEFYKALFKKILKRAENTHKLP